MIWILEKLLEEAAGKKLAGKKAAPVVLRPELGGFGGAGAGSGTAGPGGSHPAHSGGQAGPGSLERDSDRPGLTSGAQSQALLAMDNQLRGT